MSPISKKTLCNRASSKRYYEKNKDKEREKARLRMASIRREAGIRFKFSAVQHDANRISSRKFYELNKEKEREKARKRMAVLRAKRKEEALAANATPDLSDVDGDGDEHLKDLPAIEVWRQTFKRQMKISAVNMKYDRIIEGTEIEYPNEDEEYMVKSELYEQLEVEALLFED